MLHRPYAMRAAGPKIILKIKNDALKVERVSMSVWSMEPPMTYTRYANNTIAPYNSGQEANNRKYDLFIYF